MDAIEEPLPQINTAEAVKVNTACEADAKANSSVLPDNCLKSNGVADSKETEQMKNSETVSLDVAIDNSDIVNELESSDIIIEEETITENDTDQHIPASEDAANETTTLSDDTNKDVAPMEITYGDDSVKTINDVDVVAGNVEVDGIVETVSDNVRFETEILIETNIDDHSSNYKIIYSDTEEPDSNILNELGQNIELSEVLRSSDVTEHVENNNCEAQQEVFNKEELLDILEGNDEESSKEISDNFDSDCKKLETQLALQQLSRLQSNKKYKRRSSKKSESPKEDIIKKKGRKLQEDTAQINSNPSTDCKEENISTVGEQPLVEAIKKKTKKHKEENLVESVSSSDIGAEEEEEILVIVSESPKEEIIKIKSKKQIEDNSSCSDLATEPEEVSIVNALVKDWDDEEPNENDQTNEQGGIQENEISLGSSEELKKTEEESVNENTINNANTSINNIQNLNKSDSETQPQGQRRLGRVIKKKVIFDPDNPDTFTKTKIAIKKENQSERDKKEHPTPKRIKTDPASLRSKSKSPIQSKLQWKKPQPKNLKQNKRLTEIDRLLMDEGAVNMICQLTPEAPKGHKNMKSKAEFIKKIQSSSTPEGKEMKFRERKKEIRSEEGDAKRIGSGKERLSLSSSVKSPCVSEDFEAHSADDSIIYRRHSSSSYSSPCMSPRRMSDVESINQTVHTISLATTSIAKTEPPVHIGTNTGSDVFMSENVETSPAGVLNKSDFLTIKEKLNSKLSQALNKRKRDSIKAEKPSKIKKVLKPVEKATPIEADYKYVKVSIHQKLAEICIQHVGSIFNIEVINELKAVLDIVNSQKEVSVTLLSAESGTLCAELLLKPLLDQEKGATYAQQIAESVRSLLCTLERHSKLVCAAVGDRCHGLGLSMVALSDVTVASERATFALCAERGALVPYGAAALGACGLPRSLVDEIIVFERAMSAAEALHGGLVSRTIWPDRFLEQARAIAKDIAAQPTENIMLKKQLLRLKRGGSESFLAALDKERDLFVKYWTCSEGRELLRASLESTKE